MPTDELKPDDIDRLATLARLSPTGEQKERYAHQLSSVVEYVQTLQQVPTEGVDARGGVTGLTNVLADDIVRGNDDPRTVHSGALVEAAPLRHGKLVEVRAVLGGEENGS